MDYSMYYQEMIANQEELILELQKTQVLIESKYDSLINEYNAYYFSTFTIFILIFMYFKFFKYNKGEY
jgi:hypothetical protein